MLHRGSKLIAVGNGNTLDAAGSRHRGKVGIIGFTVRAMTKGGSDLAAVEKAVLEIADRSPGEIVPYHPDCRDIVFDRRAQNMWRHGKSAVADDRHARAVRGGKLGSQNTTDAEAHC